MLQKNSNSFKLHLELLSEPNGDKHRKCNVKLS